MTVNYKITVILSLKFLVAAYLWRWAGTLSIVDNLIRILVVNFIPTSIEINTNIKIIRVLIGKIAYSPSITTCT